MKYFSQLLTLCIIVFAYNSFAQPKDTTHKTPTGFSFGALPAVSFDADLGFQYGILGNIFDYGNGSIYPDYKHMLYIEASRFTRGSDVYQMFYDSKYLLPHKIRTTVDLTYMTEKGFDFYGFNGSQSVFNSNWLDKNETDYISRMFYRYQRNIFRFTTDFQGNINNSKFRWIGGIAILSFKIDSVDIVGLNKNKKEEDKLPYVENLYQKYVRYGLIDQKEYDGGNVNFLKTGLIFDSRNHEANATKGLWDEALLVYSPKFLFNNENSFTRLVLIHRQYFTILPQKLSLAYRIGYQGTIFGKTPFYFQPYMVSSFSIITKPDGLGGARTLRGIIRNRVVGDGVAYGNLEARWKFLNTHFFKSNFYFALVGFTDIGTVVQPIKVDVANIPDADKLRYFDFSKANDRLHSSAGLGLRIAMNENFILAIDYGMAINKLDGSNGFYISMGNLF